MGSVEIHHVSGCVVDGVQHVEDGNALHRERPGRGQGRRAARLNGVEGVLVPRQHCIRV